MFGMLICEVGSVQELSKDTLVKSNKGMVGSTRVGDVNLIKASKGRTVRNPRSDNGAPSALDTQQQLSKSTSKDRETADGVLDQSTWEN